MQSSWYAGHEGVGVGAGGVVYDGGGYYGGENASFYGPAPPTPSMTMGGHYAPGKSKPVYGVGAPCYPTALSVDYPAGPGDFSTSPAQMLPYEYRQQQQGVLYHHHQPPMATAAVVAPPPPPPPLASGMGATGSNNNEYQHQHHRPPGGAGGSAYQPFYPVPAPLASMQVAASVTAAPQPTPAEFMAQGVAQAASSAPFLEQPYVAAGYPPCQGPPPWNYAQCYGYYGQEPCPYVNMIDMEDFMNNEKRKEKSRDAARCRRSRETEIFTDLASLLPMPAEEVEHLDKASVMRLSIAFLRARNMLELFPELSNAGKLMEIKEDEDAEDVSMDCEEKLNLPDDAKQDMKLLEMESEMIALQALDGFLMILSAEGDVTYISENVSEYLGISQIDIMGQPIWEYSHQCDHDELREALNGRHHSPSELLNGVANSDCRPMENRDFFLRLKCTLTSRGRSVNIKSASYKVLHVTGHIACKEKEGQRQLVSIARPLPHPANIEVPLGSSTFLSKHTLGMKFSYVDDKMLSLLGYGPSDLLGKSLYDCHHGSDAEYLMGTFKQVISKGQSETSRYRFLAKTGGYAWVVTQATVIYDKQKPHSVVCVNYVISGVENKDDILSYAQLEARQQLLPAGEVEATQCNGVVASGVEPHNGSTPVVAAAAATAPSSGTSSSGVELEQIGVTAEQTLAAIPTRSGILQTQPLPAIKVGSINNNINNSVAEELAEEAFAGGVVASGGGVDSAVGRKVCVKPIDSASAAESEPARARILRELNLNSAGPGGPLTKLSSAASSSPASCRPVSVTASIFTSLPSNGGAAAAGQSSSFVVPEKPKVVAPAVKPVGGVTQSGAPALLQSVTAKLFVTLPASGGAGCNGASANGGSGAGSKPQHATEKIFAPRTEDMNKGFLMFSEEEPGLTMLKDEPDDLTHLAPTAGDACIPLEESGTFFNEMFEDFIIPDSYTLLQDELCSLDSQEDTRLDGPSSLTVVHHPSVASVGGLPCSPGAPTGHLPEHRTQQQHQQQHQQHQPLSVASSQHSPSPLSSCASSPVPSSPARSLCGSNPNSPSGTSGLGSSASSTVSLGQSDHQNQQQHQQHQQQQQQNQQHQQHQQHQQQSANNSNNDPFINYRDETSEVSPSPHLLSPGISKSPESSSLPSLCSPNGSLAEDDLAFMSLNMDEIDLTMRAPYISMSEVDDLPLLTPDDLLWGAPAATIEGATHAASGAFGLSGKFFIKDEFGALAEQSRQQQQQQQQQQSHGLISDVTIGHDSSSPAATSDSKTTGPSIESSLAALLCGGSVISIHTEPQSNASGNQILITHTDASQQQQQQSHQQPQQHHHHQQQQQQQQQQLSPNEESTGKRIKLSPDGAQLQVVHSMVALPTSVKLCDTWKFDDLLQLNGAAPTTASGQPVKPTSATTTHAAALPSSAPTKKQSTAATVPPNSGSQKRAGGHVDGGSTASSCKRLKTGGSSTAAAPQLLQQLMAPSPVPQKLRAKGRGAGQDGTGAGSGRWPNGNGGAAGLQQEQSGNSVLMNLLVSGCDDPVSLVPPETLMDDNGTTDGLPAEDDSMVTGRQRVDTADLLMSLGEEDDSDMLFSSANPLIGGQTALLDESMAHPLTIRTDHGAAGSGQHDGPFLAGKGHPVDEFSMTVSPSLLTPTDMEIWRAIQQGQLDPKKIPSYYGTGSGLAIPKSLASTPTAQLTGGGLLLDDAGDDEANLLAALGNAGGHLVDALGNDGPPQYVAFRAGVCSDETLQRGLI